MPLRPAVFPLRAGLSLSGSLLCLSLFVSPTHTTSALYAQRTVVRVACVATSRLRVLAEAMAPPKRVSTSSRSPTAVCRLADASSSADESCPSAELRSSA